METGRTYTAKVKELLKEANETNRNLYLKPTAQGFNPMRIIQVRTSRGLTLAKTVNGAEVPISNYNIGHFYIQ